MKSVTLRDVAAAAGVSVSTASRVLDDRLPVSRTATAGRVREAAERLGYRKDAAASALRRGDTGTVGVLVPRLSDTVMALLFEALSRQAADRGLFALVSVCGDEAADERRAIDALLARRVDGLVLAAARLGGEVPVGLRASGVPHVLAVRTDGVSPSAVCDDELGGYLATRHLLDLGHRRIAILPGPDFTSTAMQRLAGYRRALVEAGVATGGEEASGLVRHSLFSTHAGREAAAALLADRPGITAVFAANDQLALGTLAAAQDAGRRVPEDLSVVGYNDTPLAAELRTPLTSVRVPFERIASDALDLLTAQIQGRAAAVPPEAVGAAGQAGTTGALTPVPPVTRVSEPTLIPRRSTAPLR